MDVLVVATAIACAGMGGVFFAFSSFVMRALARVPPAHGIAAMQSINVVAVTPVFMIALFGTAVACVGLAANAVIEWRGVASAYMLAGCVSYLVGTIVVTIIFNVPLNNQLTAVDATGADAIWFWSRYVRRWTAWNHVRALSSFVAAALLLLG